LEDIIDYFILILDNMPKLFSEIVQYQKEDKQKLKRLVNFKKRQAQLQEYQLMVLLKRKTV